MKGFSISVRTAIILVVLFCIGLIGMIWNKEAEQMKADREATISQAIYRSSNLALALENYTIRTIQSADMLLQLVRWEFEKNEMFNDYQNLFARSSFDKNLLNSVAVLDENGKIVSSSFTYRADTILNFKDREYFQYHTSHPQDQIFISKPLQSGTPGKAVIVLSRRIDNADGSFRGVVFMQILPATFTSFYKGAVVQQHDIVSLIAPDGITYARQTGTVSGYGENISKSPLFKHLATQRVGSYFAKDALRGIPTYFSYRRFRQYPIIATVGTAENDVLAMFYKREQREIIYSSLITFFLILFSVVVCIGILYRRKNVRVLKANEEKYRSIFKNSTDAIILYTPGGEILDLNPAAYQVFKIGQDEERTLNFSELLYQNTINDDVKKNISQPIELNGEHKFYCRDGSSFCGEVASSSYNNVKDIKVIVSVIRDTTERRRLQKNLINEKKSRQQMITRQVIQAQEREREAIGRELHDNVSQILSTVKLYLGIICKNRDMANELLPKSMDLLVSSLHEIRNLSHELTAPTLGTNSLVDSINDLLENVNASGDIQAHFFHETYEDNIKMEQKLAIYRIVQEQLNNIFKHAQATTIFIILKQEDGETKLMIKDNGIGFDQQATRKGIGLNNIEARIKAFSGNVNIVSAPQDGCTLEAFFPLQTMEVSV
ncbi:MAG: PAS domain S-box protein, partial [Ginsengibacter sp.]